MVSKANMACALCLLVFHQQKRFSDKITIVYHLTTLHKIGTSVLSFSFKVVLQWSAKGLIITIV